MHGGEAYKARISSLHSTLTDPSNLALSLWMATSPGFFLYPKRSSMLFLCVLFLFFLLPCHMTLLTELKNQIGLCCWCHLRSFESLWSVALAMVFFFSGGQDVPPLSRASGEKLSTTSTSPCPTFSVVSFCSSPLSVNIYDCRSDCATLLVFSSSRYNMK